MHTRARIPWTYQGGDGLSHIAHHLNVNLTINVNAKYIGSGTYDVIGARYGRDEIDAIPAFAFNPCLPTGMGCICFLVDGIDQGVFVSVYHRDHLNHKRRDMVRDAMRRK